jgi:hypothetical protein
MSVERRAVTGRNGSSSDGKPESQRPPEEFDLLLELVRRDVTTFSRSIGGIAALEWRRLKLRALDASTNAAALLLLIPTILAVAVAAGVLMVLGTRDALVAWTATTWIGEIGGGVVVLGGLLTGGALARRIARLRIVDAAVRPKHRDPDAAATPAASPP